jgi:hypothetical protein
MITGKRSKNPVIREEDVTNNPISIAILDNESGEIEFKHDFNNLRQFRLLWFDEDDVPHIFGKLPWKVMKTQFREWSNTWAENNAKEFEDMVRQHRPKITYEELISLLYDIENEATKLLVPENGARDTLVASRMVRELLSAIIITVRKVANTTRTIWQFPQPIADTTNDNSILSWLFRRR